MQGFIIKENAKLRKSGVLICWKHFVTSFWKKSRKNPKPDQRGSYFAPAPDFPILGGPCDGILHGRDTPVLINSLFILLSNPKDLSLDTESDTTISNSGNLLDLSDCFGVSYNPRKATMAPLLVNPLSYLTVSEGQNMGLFWPILTCIISPWISYPIY